jgi:hypothetical protein
MAKKCSSIQIRFYMWVRRARGRKETILMLTHGQRLAVDQDIETVKRRFEDYLNAVGDTDRRDGLTAEGPDSSEVN